MNFFLGKYAQKYHINLILSEFLFNTFLSIYLFNKISAAELEYSYVNG